jgi:cellulose synthase/poly-beta-1,6-N-acetylglucosamine synthase-like glycosyltransferase
VIEFLFGCTVILLLIYALLIFYYHRIWDRIPVAAPIADFPPVRVAVIIPARNESANIENCLLPLFKQSYPAAYTEIIVVNDFSTDDTAAIVAKHSDRCRLLNLSDFPADSVNSYKKKAIETGIANSTAELIICTDADCVMNEDWILGLVSAYQQENKVFIAAPVKIIPDGSALSVFQTLDFISLQGGSIQKSVSHVQRRQSRLHKNCIYRRRWFRRH